MLFKDNKITDSRNQVFLIDSLCLTNQPNPSNIKTNQINADNPAPTKTFIVKVLREGTIMQLVSNSINKQLLRIKVDKYLSKISEAVLCLAQDCKARNSRMLKDNNNFLCRHSKTKTNSRNHQTLVKLLLAQR